METQNPIYSDPASDPAHLTDAFRSARKMYVLFSGILLGWELIGVDLPDANQPLSGSLPIRLKSPQAAPWVLLAILVYFAFHCTIEWLQCDARRRALIQSRIDFWSGHILAVLAVAVLAVQTIGRVQLADQVTVPFWTVAALITEVGAVLPLLPRIASRLLRRARRKLQLAFVTVVIGTVLPYTLWLLLRSPSSDRPFLLACFCAGAAVTTVGTMLTRAVKRRVDRLAVAERNYHRAEAIARAKVEVTQGPRHR